MPNKKISLFLLLMMTLMASTKGHAQKINFSAGYGFPAVDTKYLPEYYGVYRGAVTQSGVIAGSLDYSLGKRLSIGLMVTHEAFSAPYDGYFSPSTLPDLTVRFENWSFLMTLVRTIHEGRHGSLYIRTAIGGNAWKQHYKDANGNKVTVPPVDLPVLAHQSALGLRVKLSARAGAFVEAGYGKYIVRGGLSFRLPSAGGALSR